MPDTQHIVAFEAYLITERRLTLNTVVAYKKDIAQFMEHIEGLSKTVETVVLADLHSFLQHLQGQRCKARTVARKIATLKTFYIFLHAQYKITNIAALLATPKCESTLPRYLSEQEIQQIIAASQREKGPYAQRNSLMLLFLYGTGMRISELLELRTTDIRFDTRTVLVNGKGNKQRIIPLPEDLVPRLQEYAVALSQAYDEGVIIVRTTRTPEYLFPSNYGSSKKPLSRQAFWQLLRKLCKQAGIERDISPHQLRHSLATHLLQRGADLRSLQLLLGHETLSTMHVYTHLDTANLRSIYNKKHVRS